MDPIHSLIMSLNSQKDKNSRFSRYLTVLIAREYLTLNDYKNSLINANKVLPFYKQDCWIDLIESVVFLALKSSYLSGNSVEFIRLGLEFLGKWNVKPPVELKRNVQQSIDNLINKKLPLKLNFLGDEIQIENAMVAFQNLVNFNYANQHFTIKMLDSLEGFVQIKVMFTKSEVYVDEIVQLKIYLILNTPDLILFDNLKIMFTNGYYNQFCVKDLSNQLIETNKLHEFYFDFIPYPDDAGELIQVSGVTLTFGKENLMFVCDWSVNKIDLIDKFSEIKFKCPNNLESTNDKFNLIKSNSFTKVQYKKALVDFEIDYNSLTLMNEKCDFKILIKNNENQNIKNLELFITQYRINELQSSEMTIKDSHNVFTNNKQLFHLNKDHNYSKIKLRESLNSGETFKTIVDMQCNDLGKLNLKMTVVYYIKADQYFDSNKLPLKYICTKDKLINLETILPFKTNFIIKNNLKSIDNYWPRVLEPFNIILNLSSSSPVPIRITSIQLNLNTDIFVLNEYQNDSNLFNEKSILNNRLLCPNENITQSIRIYSTKESAIKLSIGSLTIRWKRDLEESNFNESCIILPLVSVKPCLIYVETNLPSESYAKEKLNVKYKIYNRTNTLLPLYFSIENNVNFIFSGNKEIKIYIEPNQSWTESVNYYPLYCGFFMLPKIKMTAYPDTNAEINLNDHLAELLPSYLLIIPQPIGIKKN